MSEEHEKAWLIKVTKNKCLDFLKRSCNNNKEELDENLVKEDTSLILKEKEQFIKKTGMLEIIPVKEKIISSNLSTSPLL